ncbi:hypothetical protein [Fibrobacter sp.]|uniref:hypothetical protein n=1 Tax=Fibrobacter sp. TaxID=35828 RepID=UPI0038646EF5
MKHLFKISTLGCALATALALTACGGDSSSNPKSDNDNPSSSNISDEKDSTDSGATTNNGEQKDSTTSSTTSTESNADNESLTYDVSFDKASSTFTISLPDYKECVISGNHAEWKSVSSNYSNSEIMKYSFLGDTLVLYMWDESDEAYSDYGVMYVGGTAGNIYGSWKGTNCDYNSSTQDKHCYEDESYDVQLNISEKTIVVTRTLSERDINYIKSYFRYNLIYYVDLGLTYYPSLQLLFFENDEMLTTLRVKQKDFSETGEIFTIDETTYTVQVKQIEYTAISQKATIEISANGTTCTGTFESSEMNRKYCKDENMDYFDIEEDEDASGNTYRYADYYRKENSEEFNACLNSIFPSDNATGYYTTGEDDIFLNKVYSKKKISRLSRNLF